MKADTRQHGFTLISTLFLLLVVAMLGAYMVRLSTAQHVSSALGVNALRAHYAAQSGMEWAKYRITRNELCPRVGSSVDVDGFVVRVLACRRTPVTEGAATYSLFDIQVEAHGGAWGQAEYVRRRLRATLKIPGKSVLTSPPDNGGSEGNKHDGKSKGNKHDGKSKGSKHDGKSEGAKHEAG